MDLSRKIIGPALNRITSSFASTNDSSYGGFITRMLSFTDSFNDRTSLLHEHDAELGRPMQTEEAGAAPPPPAATEAAAPPAAPDTTTAADHPFDIEAGPGTAPLAPTGTAPEGRLAAGQEEPEPAAEESRRVGESVLAACLFAASASLVLFTNLPASSSSSSNKQQQPAAAAGLHGLLYGADMAFISLGFFSSLGLFIFSSIVAKPGDDAAVARVQKWVMVVAVASVVVAFSLRVCMTLVA